MSKLLNFFGMHEISILMPSFNQGDYIEEAICSVLSQQNVSCQLIIMDGGSTDQTQMILDKYRDQACINVAPDRGQGHALNKALALATAPIIGWLNSDDAYLPGAFKIVTNAFKRNPDISLIHGQRVMINHLSEVIGWNRIGSFRPESDRYTICSETAFWRRGCIHNHVFREDLKFAIDTHFLGLIASNTKHLYLQKYIGCFRCHPSSKSSTLWEDHAVPEATTIWRELFGRSINFEQPMHKSSIAKHWDNAFGFMSLPAPLMASYFKHRVKRKMQGQGLRDKS